MHLQRVAKKDQVEPILLAFFRQGYLKVYKYSDTWPKGHCNINPKMVFEGSLLCLS